MPYKKKTSRRKRHSRRRTRTQKKQMKMRGGVDTPLFGDESMTIPMDPTENNILDDSDITPPFTPPTPSTDYGETTQESISASDIDVSLGFGGKKKYRRTRTKLRGRDRNRGKSRRRQRAGGFTITEDTSPEAYDDDYENNLANIEEVMLST